MITLNSPNDTLGKIALLLKEQRLSANLTQAELSERTNVPLATIRKFERTGKISLESFVKLVFVLGLHEQLLAALKPDKTRPASLDELLKEDKPLRQRASSKKDRT
ncbi:MAG: helix-turn-helix transcriptional regulator [Sphaerospermopsis sp. SIO1G2]|nr:helix-turn-helix transcriptional regulator [Sphaerospermopsis sp. SIO1G2]